MTTQNLIAVPELAAAGVAGGIVYWRLAGAVDYDDLEAAWLDAGLQPENLPSPITRFVALKRTMDTFKERAVMVKPLRGDAEGFVLVHEHYDASGRPSYRTGLEVRLGADGQPEATFEPGQDIERSMDLLGQIRATFAHQLTSLSQQDVSTWLVGLARGVHAVRLRDTGGIYFVPRDHLPAWRRCAAALRTASACQLFEIPAMQSEDAIAAVLDAVTREAEAAVAEMDEELDNPCSKRVLNNRTKAVAELEQKLAGYERLLGVQQATLHGHFEALQARIANALLALEDGEE